MRTAVTFRARTLTEKATAAFYAGGRKARISPRRERSGCRSEVNLKPFALLALFIVFASVSVNAQKRAAGPAPILVDVISGSVESSVLSKPRKTREFSTPVRSGANYDLERRIFGLLNEIRAENGLSPLTWNDEVAELARVHSQNMADYKFFSHRDTDGMTVDGRAESYGLSGWRGIGENIASMRGQSDPAAVAVKTWMQSPGHRQNILGGRWNDSAVGVARANDGTYYFTQVFMLR
jgi:uncharacterized protein YkwD